MQNHETIINMKRRVYISGPMTDIPREEYLAAFRQAEDLLRSKGYRRIVNPIRVWACRWPWLYKIIGYRLTLWYDIQLLKRCDQIHMIRGWQKSAGAKREYEEARRLDLDVSDDDGLVLFG